ncbi:PHD finger protein At2g01810-like [Apium graveolens]|uniref:PHD finger protein At2g01810-like n=1 Tax=Apium graveolens TaxID=4045 RepID=UPI003D790140
MASRVIEACKSRKRKRRVWGFKSFGPGLNGGFRENMKVFLSEFMEVEKYGACGLPVWSCLVGNESDFKGVFKFFVVEEMMAQHSSLPFCNHCKFIGWGHHFVSKRRYHIIIPSYDCLNKPLKGDFLADRNHLLHGLVHCNGYGHLLSINTADDDDLNSLHGNDIMDFWDRLCTTLQIRKVSLNDYSRKKALDLRLLHGVAYGTTWFGKWGYKFGHGSFGVTEEKYDRALQFFSTLRLNKIISDFKNTVRGRKIEQLVKCYREVSEAPLVTISDLLQFVLSFVSKTPIERKAALALSTRAYHSDGKKIAKPVSLSTFVSLANIDCRWPAKRIEYTVYVIVNLLNENRANVDGRSSMTRQEVRAGARSCIGDTGLIDYVLKSISCVAVDDQIVSRCVNPLTKMYEFNIHDKVKEEDISAKESSAFASSLARVDSRWPKQKLEHAAKVIVNILRVNSTMVTGGGAMSRQELRDRARQCIGDTGLIDFVLKSVNSYSMIGNQIISRVKNPSTRLIEFTITDEYVVDSATVIAHQPGLNVYGDVLFLYRNVLLGYPEWDPVSIATRVILDSKQFVKEWVRDAEEFDHFMTLTCRVLPSFDEMETELTRKLCPGEVVMVPSELTVGELKLVAQCALRDTYCLMKDFVVTQIGGLKGIEEGLMLSCALDHGAEVWVRGIGLDLETRLRYEGGPDDGKVDCVCGTKRDDGERMVACDGCHVWQHTRCRGIDDEESSPALFLCYKCVVG